MLEQRRFHFRNNVMSSQASRHAPKQGRWQQGIGTTTISFSQKCDAFLSDTKWVDTITVATRRWNNGPFISATMRRVLSRYEMGRNQNCGNMALAQRLFHFLQKCDVFLGVTTWVATTTVVLLLRARLVTTGTHEYFHTSTSNTALGQHLFYFCKKGDVFFWRCKIC